MLIFAISRSLKVELHYIPFNLFSIIRLLNRIFVRLVCMFSSNLASKLRLKVDRCVGQIRAAKPPDVTSVVLPTGRANMAEKQREGIIALLAGRTTSVSPKQARTTVSNKIFLRNEDLRTKWTGFRENWRRIFDSEQ